MTRFEHFIAKITETHEIVTASDVLALVSSGELPLDPDLDLGLFDAKRRKDEACNMNTSDTEKYPDEMSRDELAAKAEELWNDRDSDPEKKQAVALFQRAYEKGALVKAGYRLGVAYYQGVGVAKDLEKAYGYFSIPELDNARYALLYRGRILKSSGFRGRDDEMAWSALSKAAEMGVDLAQKELNALRGPATMPFEKACPICGAAAARFEKLQGRQCPDCGSVERQRVFAVAYDSAISKEWDIRGKRGLIISPSVSERRFLESRRVGALTSVDVRPETKPDIIADICAMPQIETEAYDFVYASYVLTCVHDLDAALLEIKRVLKAGGCFISIDHLAVGAETVEFTDRDKITAWYGDDNYDKYKVGSFRALSETGLIDRLSSYFSVRTYCALDPVTGLELMVVMSIREDCSICGATLAGLSKKAEACPSCGSRARTRGLPEVLKQHVLPNVDKALCQQKALLGFAMADPELKVVRDSFPKIKSASLYGVYGERELKEGHETGVDVRDLSRYGDGSYCAVMSLLLFDYFTEHEAALAQCYRVLSPGGAFVTHIAPFRLHDGDEEPQCHTVIKKKEGYFQYYPDGVEVLSIEVGRGWFVKAMQRTGFLVRHVNITDKATGLQSDWFIGFKPSKRNRCTICNTELVEMDTKNEICPSCKSRARQRSLIPILREYVLPVMAERDSSSRLLAFAPNPTEKSVISKYYDDITSASLYGDYGENHLAGVDVRDLSRFAEASFTDIAAICLFDYFIEMEKALRECFRAMKNGGVLYTHIAPFRLTPDAAPPQYTGVKLSPASSVEERIDTSTVGIKWLLAVMEATGFDSKHVIVPDVATGITSDWFIGIKRYSNSALYATCCPICSTGLNNETASDEICPVCDSRPRTRTLPAIANSYVKSALSDIGREDTKVLAIGMNPAEKTVIEKLFKDLVTASLFGEYGRDHLSGVDVRNLSRFESFSFDGVFGICFFDFFEEMEQALRECFRILRAGGVFFTLIAPFRLKEDSMPPTATGEMIQVSGTSDKRMPSVVVGKRWFLKTMQTVGFDAEVCEVVDPTTKQVFTWFLGAKTDVPESTEESAGSGTHLRSRSKSAMAGHSGESGEKAAVSQRFPQRELPRKEYSIPLADGNDFERVEIKLTAPNLPENLTNCDFAEHVMDARTGEPTDTVIVCGIGFVGVSNDLGENWRRIDVHGAEDVRLWNSFTTASGHHLVQSLGWQGPMDKVTDPEKHAALFVFDNEWNLLKRVRPGNAYWHGTASVGQAGDTIMYAEYHNNSALQAPDFEQNRDRYRKDLRPCHVWRSRDHGLHWEKVFQQDAGEIRHFHTVVPDSYLPKTWWLSSGDFAHESRVWRSSDDGDTWTEVTNYSADVQLPRTYADRSQACQRFTDTVIGEDTLLWGCDDPLGDVRGDIASFSPDLGIAERAGARLYLTEKCNPLSPQEIGYIGQSVRKFTDVGPGWILSTETNLPFIGLRPKVFLLMKQDYQLIHLFDADNYISRRTGFTYSRGSVKAKNGVFFTFRNAYDALPNNHSRILKWEVDLFGRS